MSAIGLLVAFVLVAYLAIGSAESADALAPSAEVFPITFWAMHYALYYWDFRGDYSEILSDEQYRLMKECNVYCWKGRKKEELGRFPSDRFVRGADGGLVSCAEFDGNAGAKYLVIVNRNVNEPITIAPKLRWEQVAEIEMPASKIVGLGSSGARLSDGTLLVPVQTSDAQVDKESYTVISGTNTCHIGRSTDGGRTWPEFSVLGEWCHEVNVEALPSGRVLAVIRYQRPRLPDDTPELLARTGATAFGSNMPYKHVFVAHSDDGARTWGPLRQVTTVFGQCHGSGVGLSDDRVVVVHDHRYPRSMGSGRAMVSRDAGESWEDEVYYLCHGMAAGYASTISLDGEEMLTFVGSCYGDVDKGWDYCIGRTDFVLIRWRLA